jgi:hypothetical protein
LPRCGGFAEILSSPGKEHAMKDSKSYQERMSRIALTKELRGKHVTVDNRRIEIDSARLGKKRDTIITGHDKDGFTVESSMDNLELEELGAERNR